MTTLLPALEGAAEDVLAEDALAEALRGCARGDRAGLQLLYDRLAPKMTGVALRMLRRRDLADEVVHDTFLRIWEKADSFDPARGRPTSWAFAILRNTALNALRGEGRMELVGDFEAIEPASEEADAETLVMALSEASALRRCLDRLEPARRRAILLAYMRGLTHGELAGRLGVPLGTAKAWIRRSLLTLRECMT
ncbi:sigma-70 family RNA polymerase sigma factor [Ancylobacter sp. FA202]|uniref:sigma-70 family RNA polymerase sigma factor n=1 Tax=Ancylobacter sp. FA202 TaxID=1111106 RepID=UPI000364FF76|nr:sigma-70 family RNA polymerase sigma factor [Ancylobacter sp. FA202]